MFTLVDPDLDGYTSSAILCRMRSGEPVVPVFHSKKQHGVDDEIIDKLPEHAFLWVPDSSVPVAMAEKLDAKDIVTLVMDHHPTIEEIDLDNDKHCYVCNGEVPQSGSMFMYLFARYCGYTDIKLAELGVLGNFGDVQAQNYMQTRAVNKLVEHPTHPLIRGMLHYYAEDVDTLYPGVTGWKIGPKINAVIRSTNQVLKEQLFNAMVTDEVTDMLILECDGQHQIQKTRVKGIVDQLRYDESHKVIIVETPHDDEIVGVNGLIANRIQSQKNKPVFAVTYDEETGLMRGSLRSPVAIKTILNETGLAEAQGHENAAGIKFKPEDKDKLIAELDKMDLGGDEVEVLVSCKPEELTRKMFNDFCNNVGRGVGEDVVPYWGSGIPDPLIHMTYTTRYEDIEFEGKFKSDVRFPVYGAVRYDIFRDFIGRANKVTWGIMIDTGISNRYGKTKLVKNTGPVKIEMLGNLRRVGNRYYFDVQDWEFERTEEDCDKSW